MQCNVLFAKKIQQGSVVECFLMAKRHIVDQAKKYGLDKREIFKGVKYYVF